MVAECENEIKVFIAISVTNFFFSILCVCEGWRARGFGGTEKNYLALKIICVIKGKLLLL